MQLRKQDVLYIQHRPAATLMLFVLLQNVDIERLYINSNIAFRYATTNVTSHMLNQALTPQEVTFQVTLPPAGFISKFYM